MAKQDFQDTDFEIKFQRLDRDIFIEADKVHFQNMLHNLLENAFKYNKNTPFVKIKLQILSKNKVELSVADNGISIDKKFQKQVFDKFFRIQHQDIHDVKGFGLGLSYIRQVVKSHK